MKTRSAASFAAFFAIMLVIACGGDRASVHDRGEDAAVSRDADATDVAAADATAGGGDDFGLDPGAVDMGVGRTDLGSDGGSVPVDDMGGTDLGADPADAGAAPDMSDPAAGDMGAVPPGVTDFPLPPIPANCGMPAKVITYNPNGWSHLLNAFEANATPCADYFIFVPAIAGNKTEPRGGNGPPDIRSRAGRFHAVAEFHWGAWSNVTNMTWYQKGVEFRRRMVAAGYNVDRGDTWGINELPSSTRNTDATRTNVRNLVRGLYNGPAGSPKRAGAIFIVGMGQQTANHSVYKPALKDWILDAAFWRDMDANVLWWSQETYTSWDKTCVASATVGQKAQRVNEFVMHKARLATSGPQGASTARAFFNQAYVPTLTAVWHSDLYGDTQINLDQMKHLVSLQIYANRAWANTHNYPDGRVALAWDNNSPNSTVAQRIELAERIAAAVAGAYGPSGTAAHACSPSGAFTWCGCAINGAQFNTTWSTYDTW